MSLKFTMSARAACATHRLAASANNAPIENSYAS